MPGINRKKAMKTKRRKTADRSDKNKDELLISVCLIVRNEEKYIEQCLRSVKRVADEIVLVDTGSTDRTVEIARKFTDRIYFHPWQDSFSEARNHYLTYARGKWIFQIDVDEELVREDVPLVRPALADPDVDAVSVQIISYARQGQGKGVHCVERLFRNNGDIRYEGRVHNRLVGIKNPSLSKIRLRHYGYDLAGGESEKKFQRTEGLLKKDLEENPGNPYTHHYLSCSYLSREMYDRVVFHGHEALRLAAAAGNDDVLFLWTRYNLSLAHYRMKNLPAAREKARESLAVFPDHMDAHFMMIVIGFDDKNWEDVVNHGESYLRLIAALERDPARFGRLVCCSLNEAWNIHVLVGIAYDERGEAKKAEESFRQAEASAPEPFLPLRAVGIHYARKGRAALARHYLEKARSLDKNDATVHTLLTEIDNESATSKTTPTISACMIVKDEEAFLENCLRSIKGWVDEIIIVDTGSTDRTVEIAGRFTDKVHFHPWRNSFSEARNNAMSYATGDWILTIDADEELVAGSGERLRQAVREAGDADAIYANVISVYNAGRKTARHNSERLLKNNGVIRYEGRVHNRVAGVTRHSMSKIEMMHYGYNVEEKKAQEKFFRTVALLKAQIADNPGNPMPHHYLGTSYLARNMYRESLEESLLAIDLAERQGSREALYLTTHHNAALAFFYLQDLAGAREYSLRALKKLPDHLDSLYMMTLVAAENRQWEEVLAYGQHFLKIRDILDRHPEKAGVVLNSSLKEGGTVYMHMGHAHHALGNVPERDRHYREAVNLSGEKWRPLLQIGNFHTDRSGDLPLAGCYLDLARQEAPAEPSVWFMLAKWCNQKGDQEKERSCLTRLWELGAEDPAMLNRLAVLALAADDLETAERTLADLLKAMPDHCPGLVNLAALRRRQNDPDGAVAACERAIAVDPGIPGPWMHLGEIALSLGDLGNAATFFSRVLTLESKPVKALLHLSEVALRQNDIEGLVGWCNRLLIALDLPRERTIHSIDDLVAIVREIYYALSPAAELAAQAAKILALLPGQRH